MLIFAFFSLTSVASGQITQIIDATGDGAGNALAGPPSVAVDGLGNAYVSSLGTHGVFKITPAGSISQIINATGDGAGNTLGGAAGLAVDAGNNVYVTGLFSDNVFKITPGGAISEIIDASGDGAGHPLSGPTLVAVDGSGTTYVVGQNSDNAFRIDAGGTITQIIDASGDGAGHALDGPYGVAADGAGNAYVTGSWSSNVFKITPSGAITQIIDSSGDGAGNPFTTAGQVAVDAAGNVYVTAFGSDNAFKITPAGTITEIVDASGDGTGHGLDYAEGVAVDGAGNVFVSGTESHNAFKITPTGTVTQIIDASGDGAGHTLAETTGIAVDAFGNVYVTAWATRNAFKITLTAPIYEGFDYSAGASVHGQNGGRGMAGTWLQAASGGSFALETGSLTFPDLQTTGNKPTRLTPGGNFGDRRLYDPITFASLVGGGEIWFSFLFRLGPGANINVNPFAASTGINQVLRLQIREYDGLVYAHFATGDRAEGGAFSPGQTVLFVARVVVTGPANDGENDTLQVWLDPTPGAADPDTAMVMDATFTFTSLPYAGLTYITEAGGSGDHALDEFRMGPSYASVTPMATDRPPVADAGVDFSVNENQPGVALDGTASSDPDDDPLTYAWNQIAGPAVTLSDASAAQPTFDAPAVAIGGETLTFELTVTARGESDVDTVDVTVVNVNHVPVADAGLDQSVAEGALVALHGDDSFDVDSDPFTYSWVQTGGSPVVMLSDATAVAPTFAAPFLGSSGAPGVVASLTFQLTVDDGFPPDAPAPGYTFADAIDTVTVDITNVNNDPIADAGSDQTVDENGPASLSGGGTDPDGDLLSYSWTQVGGPGVVLSGANTTTPTFTAPFVSAGGVDLTFELAVDDGYGGMATDQVVVHVANANDPPYVAGAQPTEALLWPPDHKLTPIAIVGITDPDDNVTVTIDAVTQDEPTNGTGDGDTAIDAVIQPDGTVLLRAERVGSGNGRVYHIHFTASDFEGSASGVVTVSVPKKKPNPATDDGELYDSTQ